jgi:lipooligosaccharide transport system ATP-binding protein
MSMAIVEARRVTKLFGMRPAVEELDLQVPQGLCFGLLGPNGAGKTTTLRMIYGVTKPASGSIRVFGLDIAKDPRAVRARLGVTLQQSVFIEAITAKENLVVFGRYHGMREPDLSRRADELVSLFDLGAQGHLPVRHLSGGFQRRLAIALSLMNRPELLILDEPTTGLDPAVRLALWSRVRELRAAGTTVLLTTHYMDEAQRLCDRVAIMSAGRVIDEGSPRGLIESHLAPETIEFDCNANEEKSLLDGLTDATRRVRIGGRLMIYQSDPTQLVSHLRRDDHGDTRRMVVRPTNLEDVFLTLTGTSLEVTQS